MTVDATGARVRARAWRLLADLYLGGVTEALSPLVRDLPGLGAALPEPFDADQAAAEHHRLFGLEVHPYASVFLERDAVLGGSVTESMARFFARAGVAGAAADGEAADHLGRELDLLGVLTARDDRERVADLLGGHLLWWLPVFVHSAGRRASPFWRSVLDLTLDAALDQGAGLLAPDHGGSGPPPGALALPVEDPLDEGRGGLGELARHLVTPARGGLFLSVGDLRALGRGRDLPGGFGGREQVMTNLLRSAAGYGELDGVVADLIRLVEGQAMFMERVPRRFRGPWDDRLEGLRETLARLAAGAAREENA